MSRGVRRTRLGGCAPPPLPETTGDAYTWWSNRGQAWAKNVGWRIDYQIATPGIAAPGEAGGGVQDNRFSDHAPLTIDYDWRL